MRRTAYRFVKHNKGDFLYNKVNANFVEYMKKFAAEVCVSNLLHSLLLACVSPNLRRGMLLPIRRPSKIANSLARCVDKS